MALSKNTCVDKIEIVPATEAVQVRKRTDVIETDDDGNSTVLSFSYFRYVLDKGADLTNEDPSVVAQAKAAWGI